MRITGDEICASMPNAVPGSRWSCDVEPEGIRFRWVLKGVSYERFVGKELAEGAVAHTVLRRHDQIVETYGAGCVLVDPGGERAVRGPASLFGFVRERGSKGIVIGRYKGLGEMTSTQLWETTLDPSVRSIVQVRIEDGEAAATKVEGLMGSKPDTRKHMLETRGHLADIDEWA